WYRVRAVGTQGTANDTGYAPPKSATTKPATPNNLTTSDITASGLTLHWADNSAHETGYAIERAVGDGDFTSNPAWATGANGTSFTFTDLSSETTYRFRVHAT